MQFNFVDLNIQDTSSTRSHIFIPLVAKFQNSLTLPIFQDGGYVTSITDGWYANRYTNEDTFIMSRYEQRLQHYQKPLTEGDKWKLNMSFEDIFDNAAN